MSEIKNYGKSIRARLLNVAKQEEVFYQKMQVRWTAFLRKSAINSALSFPEVVRWLQDTLRPYWTTYGLMQH